MRNNLYSLSFLALIFTFLIPLIVIGQVRESINFKIERDSINIGGGFGTSSNFQVQDTLGEAGSGFSSSTNYTTSAGYQQVNEETFIAISAPSDLNMDSINGLTGGVSTSSAAWTVTTNNNGGYELTVKAATSPALQASLDFFADYTAGSDPDFNFSIDSTTAEFGFSPSGAHIVDRFRDNGSACNISTGDSLYKCWDGFSTSTKPVAQSLSANDPTGTVTTINFRAESGTDKILTADVYSATITMTAVAL
jgi:hypothetical protein